MKGVGCSPGLRGLDPGDQRWHWLIWSPESVINLGEQAGPLLPSPGELSVGRRTQERGGGEGGAWSPPSAPLPSLSPCSLLATGLLHRQWLPPGPGDLVAADCPAQNSPCLVSSGVLSASPSPGLVTELAHLGGGFQMPRLAPHPRSPCPPHPPCFLSSLRCPFCTTPSSSHCPAWVLWGRCWITVGSLRLPCGQKGVRA